MRKIAITQVYPLHKRQSTTPGENPVTNPVKRECRDCNHTCLHPTQPVQHYAMRQVIRKNMATALTNASATAIKTPDGIIGQRQHCQHMNQYHSN